MIRMGTGERAGSKNSSKGHVSKRNVKSDDSDEDYRLEEDELDDQTDELESLAGDASDEESLGSFGDEEDQDEIVRKVVRSTPRKRSAGQTKKDINKGLKRRKRISYGEEEKDVTGDDKEEEDDYDNDCSTNDDHFLDEEHEHPFSKSKVRKIGNTDDDDYNPDNPDIFDEENLPSSKRRSKKKSDSDDDDFNPDDHDILDEEEELLSQKRKKKKKGVDDDDFNPDDQDFFDEDELPSPKGKNKKKCDTDDDEFIPEDVDLLEEEELSSPKVKNKKKHDTDDDEFNSDDLDLLDEEEGLPSSKGKYKKKGDTDDDEFYPDDFDLLDEEEEFPCLKEKNKKRGQYSLKRKRSVRGQKIKPQKKKRKRSRTSTKSTSVKSRKFKNKVPSSGICRRAPKRKKKNATLSSDSDFVSFESTDHEFTISEEEREQVREANELFQRETSNLRCVKRDQEDVACKHPRNLTRRKGKEKVQEVKGELAKQVCGICLTKEGKNTVRGTLNCCIHFFCCACIIEWSKVESRCPLCKQRFITISKSAKSAARIDLGDAVIPIPERDQVYQPSEEELRGYLDPYENVYCTECHEGGDDALMLLCDLCDSPAHTYCVGLGREVPDGNWYCEGCRPSALGFTTSHAQDHTLPSQRLDNPAINEPLAFENMAEIDLNITIPETPVTPGNGFLVSPRQPSSATLQAQPPLSGVGVSTLSGRRRVHRLQYLLSNNRSGMRVDPATSERRVNILGPWGDRSAQPPFLETTSTTDVGALYPTIDREDFPGRQNLARGQATQVPSVGDSTSYGFMQFGQVGGTNLGLNSVPGCEWLQPCTSRLNLGSGTSMSPIYNGDVDQNSAKPLQ
ncbi:hypothetical protein V2J09_023609 [Rumex salicifolius]